jgi:proliferating cell nuclear antigen PCNA
MEDSLLIKVRTEHSYVFMKLVDVLKENLNEIKIDFLQDSNQDAKLKEKEKEKQLKSKLGKSSDSDEGEDDEDDEEETSKKKKVTKKVTKKKVDSDSDSEEDVKSKKKVVKKKTTKKKVVESDSDSEEEVKIKKKITKKKVDDSDSDHSKSSDSSDESDDDKKEDKTTVVKNNGGMRIIALDEHKTVLIYVKMGSDQFAEFYVKKKKHSIGIDLVQLHKFMKTVDKESMMTMMIDKDDEQNIIFELENIEKPSNITYIQKLLDLDDTVQKLPEETNFDISVAINTVEFRKLCNEMSQFSEYVEITCTSKEITFKCQGDSNAYVKTFKNSASGVRILCTKTNVKGLVMVQAIYSLKHLVTFGKCVNLCTEMQLFLKNDWPLFIHYTIGLLGKMLVGLSPVDEKTIKRDNDYDEDIDKYYNPKKVVMKEQ